MISIECDNCEQTFEVDDAEAGSKVPCPECGDINRVPGVPEAPGAPGAASEGAPGSTGAEQEICTVRQSMVRAHPFRFVFVAAILLGGIVLAIWSRASDSAWNGWLWPGLIFGGAAGLYLLYWWLSATLWIKIIISNKRTVRYEGIVRRHTTEVLHDHVRSVDINQSLLQRIFNVGSIGIDSAGQDGIEIEVRDIPSPYRIKEIIDQHRKM